MKLIRGAFVPCANDGSRGPRQLPESDQKEMIASVILDGYYLCTIDGIYKLYDPNVEMQFAHIPAFGPLGETQTVIWTDADANRRAGTESTEESMVTRAKIAKFLEAGNYLLGQFKGKHKVPRNSIKNIRTKRGIVKFKLNGVEQSLRLRKNEMGTYFRVKDVPLSSLTSNAFSSDWLIIQRVMEVYNNENFKTRVVAQLTKAGYFMVLYGSSTVAAQYLAGRKIDVDVYITRVEHSAQNPHKGLLKLKRQGEIYREALKGYDWNNNRFERDVLTWLSGARGQNAYTAYWLNYNGLKERVVNNIDAYFMQRVNDEKDFEGWERFLNQLMNRRVVQHNFVNERQLEGAKARVACNAMDVYINSSKNSARKIKILRKPEVMGFLGKKFGQLCLQELELDIPGSRSEHEPLMAISKKYSIHSDLLLKFREFSDTLVNNPVWNDPNLCMSRLTSKNAIEAEIARLGYKF